MKRKVRQYYYNNEDNIKDFIGNDDNKTIFQQDDIFPIVQLGIQALPGTKFYINDIDKKGNGIIIGSTGIFELEAPLGTYVEDLRFDKNSLIGISNNQTEALIVDVVYEVEEEDE